MLLSLPLGRMFVCGGTGPGLKYLDSAEVLDDQSGETGWKCFPPLQKTPIQTKTKMKLSYTMTHAGEWEKARVPVKMWNSPVVALTVKAPLRMVAGSHRK